MTDTEIEMRVSRALATRMGEVIGLSGKAFQKKVDELTAFGDEVRQSLKKEHNIRHTSSGGIFSPASLADYIGQDKAKKIGMVIVQAAKIENRPLPHIMLTGGFGQGKTTLAKLLVELSGTTPIIVDGMSANKGLPSTNAPIIIDEIHNLDPEVSDSLHIRMDSGAISIIGCTTDPGELTAPFRSRFRYIHLEPYTLANIVTILDNACKRKGVIVTKVILKDIALRSRLTPRLALNYLAMIFDMMAVRKESIMSKEVIAQTFESLGIDNSGFSDIDYKYMRALPEDRPVGLQYLSAMLGVDDKTIEQEIEPYLMQRGLIDRTRSGRVKVKEIDGTA
jgi:Holliday junction DNA helicase RuvB